MLASRVQMLVMLLAVPGIGMLAACGGGGSDSDSSSVSAGSASATGSSASSSASSRNSSSAASGGSSSVSSSAAGSAASSSSASVASSTSSSANSSSAKSSSASSGSITNSADVPAGYSLAWHDEFDTDGLPDSANWVYDTEANATGWYNNELQYYAVARLANSHAAAGVLSITATREALTTASDYGGQQYTSARLITRGKASWTYGYFEIRAKLPCGQGTWPAIWMLGTADNWPASGEIDIMEQTGQQPTLIEGTIHNSATAGTSGDGGTTTLSDACSAFHNYEMTWTADKIVIAVDGKAYHTYNNPGTGTAAWPFSAPQYLLLNLAIGGDMGGTVDDSIFPRSMLVEYVRVYQKK